MNGESFASVWDALTDTPADAADMRSRSDAMVALIRHIEAANLTPAQAAAEFGVGEARIGDLMRGKIGAFDTGMLAAMLSHGGLAPGAKTC